MTTTSKPQEIIVGDDILQIKKVKKSVPNPNYRVDGKGKNKYAEENKDFFYTELQQQFLSNLIEKDDNNKVVIFINSDGKLAYVASKFVPESEFEKIKNGKEQAPREEKLVTDNRKFVSHWLDIMSKFCESYLNIFETNKEEAIPYIQRINLIPNDWKQFSMLSLALLMELKDEGHPFEQDLESLIMEMAHIRLCNSFEQLFYLTPIRQTIHTPKIIEALCENFINISKYNVNNFEGQKEVSRVNMSFIFFDTSANNAKMNYSKPRPRTVRPNSEKITKFFNDVRKNEEIHSDAEENDEDILLDN